ncbi:hypothetical protein [Nocardioides pinisoli]|uniref:Lipoprotein n=1 Tax=Nocardioides pinisoli TaxID=2950279 RepID=A0ABT1KUZ3_9ACTN|nr:hypothetical protein [Nocardioides pinisoli]MCP3421579.1 hypothetical protein [Nocardioides pinisoli]
MSRHVHRSSTARLLPALAATLVLVLSGCGSADDTTATDDTSPTESTSDSPSEQDAGTLALTADGSTAGKCAMPSAEVLSTFDTAFEGTVTSVEDGTATLEVEQWYAGGEASTVTVEAPGGSLDDLLMAVDFQEGQTYLVSADGDRVTLCGFTAEVDPELEAMYTEAFPG